MTTLLNPNNNAPKFNVDRMMDRFYQVKMEIFSVD